ncbi:MAG: DUF2306 domain-containing protein [Cohaesibacter sp.]|nr:DUF2306 domain-containing protein [Cohaesibacter sp.]
MRREGDVIVRLMVGIHLYAALGALILGAVLLALPKGSGLHRLAGRFWALLMLVVAFSAFGLSSHLFGFYLSPLHGLALYTLVMLFFAYRYARSGQIDRHRKAMMGLYWGALVVPGLIAILWPGRFLNQVVMRWMEWL